MLPFDTSGDRAEKVGKRSADDERELGLGDHLRLAVGGEETVIARSPEVLEAIEIIDWWREGHARPLSRVAANATGRCI